MIKKLIAAVLERRIDRLSMRKSRKILKNIQTVPISAELIQAYGRQWGRFGKKPSARYVKIFSSIHGAASADFVPENLYLGRIEAALNKKAFALAYADKNFYERYLPEFRSLFPTVFLRGINGSLVDAAYRPLTDTSVLADILKSHSEFILKPASETSGGRNVLLLKILDKNFLVDDKSLDQKQFVGFFRDKYRNNFVLQEKIVQHPFFASFNHSSLNTVRLFTYRSVKDERVLPLQAVLRFGRAGSLVDNQAAGGLSIGINAAGLLNDFCVDKWGIKKTLPEMNIAKPAHAVPGFCRMQEIAGRIGEKYFFHRLLGFDFCLTEQSEVKLLEINCRNIETNFLQMNNGPLFGAWTAEVIDHCLQSRKAVVLDFEV